MNHPHTDNGPPGISDALLGVLIALFSGMFVGGLAVVLMVWLGGCP